MNHLESETGCEKFILHGLCSGADAALAATEQEARELLDAFASQLEDEGADAAMLRDFETRFAALPPLPERLQRALGRRFGGIGRFWRGRRGRVGFGLGRCVGLRRGVGLLGGIAGGAGGGQQRCGQRDQEPAELHGAPR